MRQLLLLVGILGGLGMAGVAAAGDRVQGPAIHTDRTQWFQVMVPEAWSVAPVKKGAPEVLVLEPAGVPGVRVALSIRRLPELPELVTREQVVEQARAMLRAATARGGGATRPGSAATVHRTPVEIREVTGWPMTGVVAGYVDRGDQCDRVTVLIDVPRQRAFVWTASAPRDQFAGYDVTFDQAVAGLVPALPEG